MKELKGIDENTAIKLNSPEEREKCVELFKLAGWEVRDSKYSGYFFPCEDNVVFDHDYLEGEKVITAAEFIHMNTEPYQSTPNG